MTRSFSLRAIGSALLLQLIALSAYAVDAEPPVDKASPGFTIAIMIVMVLMIVAPLVWWAMRELKAKKK